MSLPVLKCAIYTRKSTEEGLDQEFNSLDAQTESCASYITSQKGSGWVRVEKEYSDGGYSGGTLERPALKKLMADIAAGLINIVVVYKIDRLTRSLTDFSKLVEVFDQHGVTFVSVTQAFNTTTSMGRLTLNVLLSFAQFEREVIGERVRDKIAASKQKGMWMGGAVPVGYKCEDRKLLPDPESKETVERIFNRYLELGSVSMLKVDLDRWGYKSPVRSSKKGIGYGGYPFSRGLLYKILKNPIYIGKVVHKDKIYDGQHEAIIPLETWEKVQKHLKDQAVYIESVNPRGGESSLLKGKIFDQEGNPYSPSFTVKNGKRYRYYVSQAVLQNQSKPQGVITRLPAKELEEFILSTLEEKLKSGELLKALGLVETDWEFQQIVSNFTNLDLRSLVEPVLTHLTIQQKSLMLEISLQDFSQQLEKAFAFDIQARDELMRLEVMFTKGKAKSRALEIEPAIKAPTYAKGCFDIYEEALQKWLQGVLWRDEHFTGLPIEQLAKRDLVSSTHINKYINRSFVV